MVKKKKPKSYRTKYNQLRWRHQAILDDYAVALKSIEAHDKGFKALQKVYSDLVSKYNNLIEPQKETEKII